MIKEKTGVKTIDLNGEDCVILGPPDAVSLAEAAVRQLIERGYMALAYDDFESEHVAVVAQTIPNIVGEKGAVIQVIKKECKVEVSIPANSKDSKPGQKV